MSEFINNTENRINNLYAFTKGIINKEKGSLLVKKYQEAIDMVQPFDVVAVVDRLMAEGIGLPELKTGINKTLNMFYSALVAKAVPDYGSIPFLKMLADENGELNRRLIALRPDIKEMNSKYIGETEKNIVLTNIRNQVNELTEFEVHYIKKENILFPYIEKYLKAYRCLPLMWAYHDDIRRFTREIVNMIDSEAVDMKRLNRLIGDLFFTMYAIRFREEYILFPVVFDLIPATDWAAMMAQSYEVGFAFINTPEKAGKQASSPATSPAGSRQKIFGKKELGPALLDFETGQLSLEQAIKMLNHLPVDMTLVDENDEVRYFSTPGHRIFPRSKAIIGRKVENCHPPSSVHIVTELLDAFKAGKKDKESFWIQMGEKFILIQYFALRDEKGVYKGTLEVSQDVSEIRSLTGEKRLLE
ncbi:MAG: PAS domain-containing protein [Bacteroidales bacterium]|nr:PAS domain-containing protein [Bacteroidales bacterium]